MKVRRMLQGVASLISRAARMLWQPRLELAVLAERPSDGCFRFFLPLSSLAHLSYLLGVLQYGYSLDQGVYLVLPMLALQWLFAFVTGVLLDALFAPSHRGVGLTVVFLALVPIQFDHITFALLESSTISWCAYLYALCLLVFGIRRSFGVDLPLLLGVTGVMAMLYWLLNCQVLAWYVALAIGQLS